MNSKKVGLCALCLLVLWLVGCSSSQNEMFSYKKSGINDDFPVPAHAESDRVQFDNPTIKEGVQYSLENVGGEQGLYPPTKYFEEIKRWNWEEVESEQMGHVHFFKKGDTMISIEIKEDHFNLYEMKGGFDFSQ